MTKLTFGFMYIIVYLSFMAVFPTVIAQLSSMSLDNADLVQQGATIKLIIQVIYLVLGLIIFIWIISPEQPPQYGGNVAPYQ